VVPQGTVSADEQQAPEVQVMGRLALDQLPCDPVTVEVAAGHAGAQSRIASIRPTFPELFPVLAPESPGWLGGNACSDIGYQPKFSAGLFLPVCNTAPDRSPSRGEAASSKLRLTRDWPRPKAGTPAGEAALSFCVSPSQHACEPVQSWTGAVHILVGHGHRRDNDTIPADSPFAMCERALALASALPATAGETGSGRTTGGGAEMRHDGDISSSAPWRLGRG